MIHIEGGWVYQDGQEYFVPHTDILEPHEAALVAARDRALRWLTRQLCLPFDFPVTLRELLDDIMANGTGAFYTRHVVKKKSGGTRIILVPNKELALVQRRVNQNLLSDSKLRHPDTYGFVGGSVLQALEPHKFARAFLKFDVKDAFFQIDFEDVFEVLRRLGFGQFVAHSIATLCLVRNAPEWMQSRFGCTESFLPQGAPTSPRLFQLCCWRVNDRLRKIANRERVCGEVTQYADNFLFSLEQNTFPRPLRRAIIHDVERRRLPVHKIRIVSGGKTLRALGLNIQRFRIQNTRAFKREFRKTLHHLGKVLDLGLPYEKAWSVATGKWGFAVKATLSSKLASAYERCSLKFFQRKWGQ